MQYLFEEVGSLDRRCYEQFALSETVLMEHAAAAMVRVVRERFVPGSRVMVVCGSGNNGADGIAAACLLHGDFDVRVALPFGVRSEMAQRQYARLEALDVPLIETPEPCEILIDALFGSGLSRAVDPTGRQWLQAMNASAAFTLACDTPSGLHLNGRCDADTVKAELTVTMGALKRGLFSDAAKAFVGEIVVADLGLARRFYETSSPWQLLDRSDLALPHRTRPDVHKGSFGHLVVLCGDKPGAALLCSRAALRFGSGLVTLLAHEPVSAPDALMQNSSIPATASAFALGMGLGNTFGDEELLRIATSGHPVVCDADLFTHPMIEHFLKRRDCVMTPHPREFVALLACTGLANVDVATLQADRFGYVEQFCHAFPHVTLLLKGANVIIGQHDRYYVNPHGTNVLAKGGSGDVLAGLIGALLAQGYAPLEAAVQASLAHTEAARNFPGNSYALLPDDLIDGVVHL